MRQTIHQPPPASPPPPTLGGTPGQAVNKARGLAQLMRVFVVSGCEPQRPNTQIHTSHASFVETQQHTNKRTATDAQQPTRSATQQPTPSATRHAHPSKAHEACQTSSARPCTGQ
eukprot:Tamp_30936.p2 GENE.Tamp_30936~~Tamp_30936.p2  ORF type:complete len:115 (+),score=8.83 Tamp_30936:72-416(+)